MDRSRHSIPLDLKEVPYRLTRGDPPFKCKNVIFDITKKKSKDYFSLIISKKPQLPNNAQKLTQHFNL